LFGCGGKSGISNKLLRRRIIIQISDNPVREEEGHIFVTKNATKCMHEELAKDVDTEFAGAVLRPHAYLMREKSEKAKKVAEALRKAGSELVKRGRMPKSLLEVIGQPLISEEEYRSGLNDDYIKVKRRTKD